MDICNQLESLSQSTPRIKGEQGSLFKGGEDLGSRIRIEIVSWKHRWPTANNNLYIDLFCFVTWTEARGEISPEERELCILQCSQTSAGAFQSFSTSQGLEAKGVDQPLDEVEVMAVKRTVCSRKYTSLNFHALS